MLGIELGREVCGDLRVAECREWLVTNGIGGYASGTVSGVLTRRYHGLLIAALNPPLGRTLLLSKLDETVVYDDRDYPLYTNRYVDASGLTIDPHGYRQIEQFAVEGGIPVWRFAIADAVLEKRVWMARGENTTYVQYRLVRGTRSLKLSIRALVNYRDYHGDTQGCWEMAIDRVAHGLKITADPEATPFYLLSLKGEISPAQVWHHNFDLAMERERGLCDRENHLHAGTLEMILKLGESLTVVASRSAMPNLDGNIAYEQQRSYEHQILEKFNTKQNAEMPDWIRQLVLAADQFVVDRAHVDNPFGKTILAGYPWFSDWGRDTMISLPGLTLVTGRPEIARSILRTFARVVDRGMLPNRFPDAGDVPEYNTVDATLWYFEAIRLYYRETGDLALLQELFPVLAEIISWHCQGTRYGIHVDDRDGLLFAGESGVQLTWMDAKVGDWVVTPRIGKPIEVNALWYNAVRSMGWFARCLGQPDREYEVLADRTLVGFDRFWNDELGYCYDVIDGPAGNDGALRPNQIFAVSLVGEGWAALLSPSRQRAVVEMCGRKLLTSYGLRSLSPDDPAYQGHYGGDQLRRDGAYHQGTVWGWLLGAFVMAHWQVYGDRELARSFLLPMADHLRARGVGSLGEIFDGDEPIVPRGCFAQAWTVAEVLRAWGVMEGGNE